MPQGSLPREVPARPAPRRELSGKLAGLSLPRQVLVLAIWPLLEQMLNSLVGIVDTGLAGRLGIDAANAIAVTGYVGWLMGMLQMAVGIGSTALIARAIGGKHRRVANAALGQSLLLGLGAGFIMGAAVWVGATGIGRFFQLEGEALALCVTYLRIIATAAPLSALLFVGGACLRGAGDTRSPFAAMTLVNIVNTSVSVLLVFGPAPFGGWGVAGIAIGTAVAWALGAVLIIGVLISGRGGIRLHLHRLRPHVHTSKRILRVGLPNLLESGGMWFGNAVIARVVGGLPIAAALGAHIITIRIESFSFLPAIALGTAAATLTGQYLGLGDEERARQAARLCWLIGAGVMALMGIVFYVGAEPLARLLAPGEPELYELSASLLRIAAPVQFFFGTYLVLSHALRGAGDTKWAMMMTYASTFLVRVPGVWLLAVPMGMGLKGAWIALSGELVIRGSLFLGRFWFGGWQKVQV